MNKQESIEILAYYNSKINEVAEIDDKVKKLESQYEKLKESDKKVREIQEKVVKIQEKLVKLNEERESGKIECRIHTFGNIGCLVWLLLLIGIKGVWEMGGITSVIFVILGIILLNQLKLDEKKWKKIPIEEKLKFLDKEEKELLTEIEKLVGIDFNNQKIGSTDKKIESTKKIIDEIEEKLPTRPIKIELEKLSKEKQVITDEMRNKGQLHRDYWNRSIIKRLHDYLEKGRADTLKEAINLYEEEEMKERHHREKLDLRRKIAIVQAEIQAEIAAEQAEQAERIARDQARQAERIAEEQAERDRKIARGDKYI